LVDPQEAPPPEELRSMEPRIAYLVEVGCLC